MTTPEATVRRTRAARTLLLAVLILGAAFACGENDDVTHDPAAGNAGSGGEENDHLATDAAIAPSSNPLRVQTLHGPVVGFATTGARVFAGVPYAAPPVGELRFASPRAPDAWQVPPPGAPTLCPQPSGTGIVGDESCLTLDVWLPPEIPAEPLAVMVWIHGGGFTAGSGFLLQTPFPDRDVIVVAINYRLGALGFLAHPALTEEAGRSGNYAIEDQRLALEWVRDNIAAFGGDASRVTIFGESAGGSAVCALMWSEQARGLFHRAIIQSGALCGRQSRMLAQGEAQGVELATAVACESAAEPAACLRALGPNALLTALSPRTLVAQGAVWGPLVDGEVFLRALPEALARGELARMPTIVGAMLNEGIGFLPGLEQLAEDEYRAALEASPFFGEHASELLEAYPASAYASPHAAYGALVGHRVFNCPARRTARALASMGSEVFGYLFSQGAALHAGELSFLFGMGATPSDELISKALKDYWTRFAMTGDPNGGGDPEWPRFGESSEEQLVIQDPIHIEADLLERECDLWDALEL